MLDFSKLNDETKSFTISSALFSNVDSTYKANVNSAMLTIAFQCINAVPSGQYLLGVVSELPSNNHYFSGCADDGTAIGGAITTTGDIYIRLSKAIVATTMLRFEVHYALK